MKLAEALMLRADTQRRVEELKQRLLGNVKVQEGDEPAEDPQGLLAALENATEEWTALVQRINRTNAATELEGGATLSDALALRDVLKRKHSIYREIAQAAMITHDRYSRSEVKFKSTIKISEIQSKADGVAKAHRELDARIQACNWNTELLD